MNNVELLNDYLCTHFPNLQLVAPLFYNAKGGIRFEIGSSDISNQDPRYMKFVYLRAKILFNEVFSNNQAMFLVVNSHRFIKKPYEIGEGLDIFRSYLTNKDRLTEVGHIVLPHVYGDKEHKTHRFCLMCKVNEIDNNSLLKAIGNKDFAIKPKVVDDVFFVNIENHVIYYLYDDCGLDIVAQDKQAIMPLYEKYYDWILNYDLEKIISTFQG